MIISATLIAVSLVLFTVAVVTLWWMMHAWRTPETLSATKFAEPDGACALSFSLLVPARYEQDVLGHTIERLLESTHTEYEIIIIVGHDDPGTTSTAIQLASRDPDRVRVVTDTNEVKTKPKALNTALPHCRGDIVGVFDAEDQVHPELLAHVDHAFRLRNADVVQGGVQLVNYHSSWYSLRNCLEYFFWFRSRLHLHAKRGFIPLAGNTVFVRTRLLRETGGWDPVCLAEDCDLGVRLSSLGARVVVAYDALIVTREETPDSLYGLFRQRTRWNQGFLQVYRKKEWRQLSLVSRRMLARYTLATPFLQAFAGISVPVGIAIGIFLRVPVTVALITFLPALPTLAVLAFEVAALHDFSRQYELRIRWIHYFKLVIGSPFYQLVLLAAALRAVWRESTGRNNWELTRHVGAHLPVPRSDALSDAKENVALSSFLGSAVPAAAIAFALGSVS
jgi:cellulose synthase/poly-beta-1,6-N-acetylglucosamine synthase-like glycosyltransferase